MKQDCASTVGNKRQCPMNEFKAKRTRYARVSSSYSEELSKTLHRVLQTALENQLRTPVPQPQSFDDSPTLEAPSLELCLRLCRRSHTPSFALSFSSNPSSPSLGRLRFRRRLLEDVSSLPEQVEGISPASSFINCIAGPSGKSLSSLS